MTQFSDRMVRSERTYFYHQSSRLARVKTERQRVWRSPRESSDLENRRGCKSSAARQKAWKQSHHNEQDRECRDHNRGQPGREIVEPSVYVCAHQLAVVHESENGDQDHRQEHSIDDLRYDQNMNQWQARHHRDKRAHSHQKRENTQENRRFAKAARDAFLESERFAD